jgi:cytochrome b pre-mRNA-processing protein 3
MFQRLFGAKRSSNRAIADAIYGQIVAAARQPQPYADWGVPDTPLGRFEMLSLTMMLFLHRLRGEGGAAAALAQEVTDSFFLDVDHSLRELGIGDLGVPKRMKKLARMFYGRAESYGAAIEAKDRAALAAALRRNIRPDLADWRGADALAEYVLGSYIEVEGQATAAILAGRIDFAPQPLPEEA